MEKSKWYAVMSFWLRLEKSIAVNFYLRMPKLKAFQLSRVLSFQKRSMLLLPRLLNYTKNMQVKSSSSWIWNFCVCHKSCCAILPHTSLPPTRKAFFSMRTVNFQLPSKTVHQISKFRDAVTATYKNKKPAAPNKKTLQKKSVQMFYCHMKPALHPTRSCPIMFIISLWSNRFKS